MAAAAEERAERRAERVEWRERHRPTRDLVDSAAARREGRRWWRRCRRRSPEGDGSAAAGWLMGWPEVRREDSKEREDEHVGDL